MNVALEAEQQGYHAHDGVCKGHVCRALCRVNLIDQKCLAPQQDPGLRKSQQGQRCGDHENQHQGLNSGRYHPKPLPDGKTPHLPGYNQLGKQRSSLSKQQQKSDQKCRCPHCAQQSGQNQLGVGHLFRQFRCGPVDDINDVFARQVPTLGSRNNLTGPVEFVIPAQGRVR